MFTEDGEVQHVGVGEDEAAVVADPAAVFGGSIAVILGWVGGLEETALGGVLGHIGGSVE